MQSRIATTRVKRCSFVIIGLAGILVLAELVSWIALMFIPNEPVRIVHGDRMPIDPKTEKARQIVHGSNLIAHPYYGYIKDPNWFSPTLKNIRTSDLFHFDNFCPDPSVDRIDILVTGGSLAGQFLSPLGEKFFTDAIREFPAFKNREFEFYNACAGGYKQPQQLNILNFLLARGARYDLVINLDGFNDVVLPVSDNLRQGVNVYYPRRWDLLMSPANDPAFLRLLGQKTFLVDKRNQWIDRLESFPWRYSAALRLVAAASIRTLDRRITALADAIEKDSTDSAELFAKGPPNPEGDETTALQDLARFWMRCSLQMDAVCRAYDMPYIHVLQPNQYAPKTKSFSTQETNQFIDHPIYRSLAGEAYPYLIENGKVLAEAGVDFHDLTPIFKEIEETVYQDNCCHLNRLGIEILATHIAVIAAESLQEEQQ